MMDKIKFKDGVYDRADFEDKFNSDQSWHMEIVVCETFEEFHHVQQFFNGEYGLSQLNSATSFDDLFLRIQKAKRTVLSNIDYDMIDDYVDLYYGPQVKYSKKEGKYVEADTMRAYIGHADGTVGFTFTNLSKVKFEHSTRVYEWNPSDMLILFPYRGDTWALVKDYY